MSDCKGKHKNIQVQNVDWGGDWGFFCDDCNEGFPSSAIVILTKSRHDLLQAVVEAVKRVKQMEYKIESGWETPEKHGFKAKDMLAKDKHDLYKALDALDKGGG